MRISFLEKAGFAYFAYLNPISSPAGFYHLTISSQWKKARNPDAEQVQLQLNLSRTDIDNLIGLLKSAGQSDLF